jgi:Glycosyl hydrolases family 25
MVSSAAQTFPASPLVCYPYKRLLAADGGEGRLPASEPSYLSGIDGSYYQGEVDWPSVVASGVSFAFIKATDGLDDIDPRSAQNWAGARAAGIVRGAYHFFRPRLMLNNRRGISCAWSRWTT